MDLSWSGHGHARIPPLRGKEFSDELLLCRLLVVSEMEVLDEMDQTLIQHIRTAGLRKAREVALIDEIMEIRRERRKLFSTLSTKMENLEKQNFELKAQEDEKAIKSSEELNEKLVAKQDELSRLKQKCKLHINELNERHAAQIEDINEKISKKYEGKLQLLESKIEELSSMKQTREKREADQSAQVIVQEQLLEVERKHAAKIQKCDNCDASYFSPMHHHSCFVGTKMRLRPWLTGNGKQRIPPSV